MLDEIRSDLSRSVPKKSATNFMDDLHRNAYHLSTNRSVEIGNKLKTYKKKEEMGKPTKKSKETFQNIFETYPNLIMKTYKKKVYDTFCQKKLLKLLNKLKKNQ
ncbi:unnamed protein product [Rhizophagus irregularis]|nr:unnamed protein product [Rhizophagus irregularis]